MVDKYYPDVNSKDFQTVLNKYEFQEQPQQKHVYQDPRQLVLRNLISKNTLYDSMLLFWSTGVGKSCAAITIAEGFKEYVSNMGRKIIVLVKNGNIEKNFKNELLTECSRNAYVSEAQANFLKTSKDKELKGELSNRITRKINKVYNFMTYGTFVNRVLGMKVFEKDNFGRNTTKQRKTAQGVGVRNRPADALINLNNTVIIVDEAHNITNNDVYTALSLMLSKSYNYRLILLTATPMYDNPKEIFEISNLLNMNNKTNIMPIRNDLFKTSESQGALMKKQDHSASDDGLLKNGVTVVSSLGMEKLTKAMMGKVSYLQANTDTFPAKIDVGEPILRDTGSIKIVLCYMSRYQFEIYQHALKVDSKDEPTGGNDADDFEEYPMVTKSSSLYKNSSDASTMTYPNRSYGKDGFLQCFKESKSDFQPINDTRFLEYDGDLKKYSSKLYNLLSNINASPGNAFIYSNYVSYGGTALLKQVLLANGYTQYKANNRSDGMTFIVYDDSTNVDTREHQRKIFNSEANANGELIKIIIGSPVISEGITLKNVRQVHILEPAWNMSRINQIIGRAVRHHSHDALPLVDRNVHIYKYCSVYKSDPKTYFIDKEKYLLAEEKDRSNKVVERLLKRLAFDCNNNPREQPNKNGSAECDYTNCEYSCLMNNGSGTKVLDKFTYDMYINFFAEYDIEINTTFIRDLFKKYFVWSIDDIINKIKQLEPIISTESIYTSLQQMIDNKTILVDQYDREGFLLLKSNYVIFNPIDIDINTSIYSKMLDFSVDANKYNLNEYVKTKLKENLEAPVTHAKVKQTKTKQTEVVLGDMDMKYNKKVMKNKVYGSYRERATKESGGLFGAVDNKFRIIDLRSMDKSEDDKRKNISGMAATSYNKRKLLDIVQYLDVTLKDVQKYLGYPSDTIVINKLGIEQLVDIIEKHLHRMHLILK